MLCNSVDRASGWPKECSPSALRPIRVLTAQVTPLFRIGVDERRVPRNARTNARTPHRLRTEVQALENAIVPDSARKILMVSILVRQQNVNMRFRSCIDFPGATSVLETTSLLRLTPSDPYPPLIPPNPHPLHCRVWVGTRSGFHAFDSRTQFATVLGHPDSVYACEETKGEHEV